MSGILVVDDDETFAAVLAGALARRGHEVATAHSSREAFAALDRGDFDRLVLDLRLAHENGLDLVAAICQKRPGIRIVVLTGYASIATAVEAIKLGAHHYLTKPTDVTTLLAAFEHQTSGEGHATPPEEPTSLERMEWETIQQVMLDVDGNVTLAAARLGLHRRTLQRKLKKRPAGMQ
jgi:two-component system response regulator RegA